MLSFGSIASLGSALSGFSHWSWLAWRGERGQLRGRQQFRSLRLAGAQANGGSLS
jgi:hypothetical protein